MPVVGVCRRSIVPAVVLEDEMMDTKEAIKELEDLTVDYGNRNEEQIARLDEAIDMAMDALRNLPNRLRQAMDTISRKDTIEAIQQHFNPTGEELPTELASVLAGVGVVIGTMPPAQQEKRTEERTETHGVCLDAIDRQAAIDAVKWGITYARAINTCTGETKELFKVSNYALNEAVERLKELPPAQPERRWIPCSERLPEDDERVLATHLGGLNPDRQVIEHIYKDGKFTLGWDMDMNMDSPTFGQRYMGDAIAWMPLPEPYKGE